VAKVRSRSEVGRFLAVKLHLSRHCICPFDRLTAEQNIDEALKRKPPGKKERRVKAFKGLTGGRE
jgi:hypothetical protein